MVDYRQNELRHLVGNGAAKRQALVRRDHQRPATMAAIPRYMVVSAWLAGGVAAVQALVTVIICCVLLIAYDNCPEEVAYGKGYFFYIMNTHFLKAAECSDSLLYEGGLLDAARVRIWVIIILSFSLLWLVLSAGLITVADSSDEVPQTAFQPLAFTWSAATAAVIVIDVTTGTLFAIDFSRINDILVNYEGAAGGAYALDMLRFATFVLMSCCFKWFVLLVINIVFAGLMATYGYQAGKIVATSEHSVHTRGVLRAYTGTGNKLDDPWRQQSNYDSMMYERGSHVNRAFENSSSRSWQEPSTPAPAPLTDSRGFDRSDSWHPVKQVSELGGSRPFSYLEEPRLRSSPAPAAAASPGPALPPWRRAEAWEQPPHVPAPDYSPKHVRKLKSALKPNY